jgi:predicted DCC family thiol-disulfide oxidoreductase YuxK
VPYTLRWLTAMSVPNPIVLYDGVCGLCNRLVRFILRRDRGDQFRFASLQNPFATAILHRHGISDQLNTVYVVLGRHQPDERLLSRSNAILFILPRLGGNWRLYGTLPLLIPRPLRDLAYTVIARNRYRLWGKYDSCPLPDPKQRWKFLDE